jgi:aryl-alcohol dehydrogenase-like predicted oxidoreductase
MIYRTIPNTELKISAVGAGTWAIGGDFWGEVNEKEAIEGIQAYINHGVNFIDTAPAYGVGASEKLVAKAIRGKRDKVIIATKLGLVRAMGMYIRNLKPERVAKEIDESLKNLEIDCIDLYQIHWPDPNTPIELTLEALQKEYEKGKFRYLGVSNFSEEQISEASKYFNIVSLQAPYSMLHRDNEQALFPYCSKNNMGVLTYGTLVGGLLSGKFKEIPVFEKGDNRAKFYNYFKEPEWSKAQKVIQQLQELANSYNASVAQIAINWTLNHEGISSVLTGARNAKQAEFNSKAAFVNLKESDILLVRELAEELFPNKD